MCPFYSVFLSPSLSQPILPSPLPSDRRQPRDRVASQREAGSHTLLSDKKGAFVYVKPVAWVRNRAGDENHWAKKDYIKPIDSTSAALVPPHPSLIEFQREQAKVAQRQQASKAASVESPTTNSTYGAHTLTQDVSSSSVNSIGSEQILEQQSKLWAPLDATSKRLGFGISQATPNSPFYAIEKEQDRRRFMSVASQSYRNPTAQRLVIARPDSMNRTTCLFPIQPVNKYAAPVLTGRHESIRATTLQAAQRAQEEAAAAQAASKQTSPVATPTHMNNTLSQLSPRSLQARANQISTAHSLGYGRRHSFHRHYLTSVPDL